MMNELNREGLQDKLLSGNATFTISNEEKGTHRTFKIHLRGKDVFWVYLLAGSNNDDNNDYQYIGHINTGRQRIKTTNKVFRWFWLHLTANTLPKELKVYHSGRCLRCGRMLTTPKSIQNGIGPVCGGKI